MLIEQIKSDLITAQKKQDNAKLACLRFLLSEVNNLLIAKYPPEKGGVPATGLPDGDVIAVVQKLVKTHKESIEAFKAGGRQDLVEREERELAILQKYLPAQMSEEEIKKVVEEVRATGLVDFGQVMKEVMGRVKGKADGATVAKIVKDCLPKV